jgi:hypothetical protein
LAQGTFDSSKSFDCGTLALSNPQFDHQLVQLWNLWSRDSMVVFGTIMHHPTCQKD